MTAPERIWLSRAWASTFTEKDERENAHPYILATPEALAASPEVQALVKAERERAIAAVIATCDSEIARAKKLGPMHVPIIISVKHDCIAAIRAGTEGGE